MLGLKLPTDPRWVNIVEKNIEEILTDHAYCEQKATSTAISLIVSFPEYTELVQEMIKLVKEEMSHFKMVHDKILERGWILGRDRKDDYVIQLITFFPKGGSRTTQLIHRLLYAALIEARSCERFK
ncbi:tRNA isopentenyl-2-thiomethyl-A-37 hydroxylase MiaE, partial [Aquimarina spinulae]